MRKAKRGRRSVPLEGDGEGGTLLPEAGKPQPRLLRPHSADSEAHAGTRVRELRQGALENFEDSQSFAQDGRAGSARPENSDAEFGSEKGERKAVEVVHGKMAKNWKNVFVKKKVVLK